MSYGYGKRGMELEEMIELSNEQYMYKNRALIQKIPTPIKVTDIDNNTGKIKSGFYEKKSTVDFLGVYRRVSIAFDAKSTSVETRFDLSNVKKHQIQYLNRHSNCGGISFLLIYFSTLDESYVLPFGLLKKYWDNRLKDNGRKSIPYSEIAKDKFKVKSKNGVILDYLTILDNTLLNF